MPFLTLEWNRATNWSIICVVNRYVLLLFWWLLLVSRGFGWLVGLLFFCFVILIVYIFETGTYCIAQGGFELVILRWYQYQNTGKLWRFEKGKEARR